MRHPGRIALLRNEFTNVTAAMKNRNSRLKRPEDGENQQNVNEFRYGLPDCALRASAGRRSPGKWGLGSERSIGSPERVPKFGKRFSEPLGFQSRSQTTTSPSKRKLSGSGCYEFQQFMSLCRRGQPFSPAIHFSRISPFSASIFVKTIPIPTRAYTTILYAASVGVKR